jgi:hypothetical protein
MLAARDKERCVCEPQVVESETRKPGTFHCRQPEPITEPVSQNRSTLGRREHPLIGILDRRRVRGQLVA